MTGALRDWWRGLDEGAWIEGRRVPGDRLLRLALGFRVVGGALIGFGHWLAGGTVFALGVILLGLFTIGVLIVEAVL